MITKIGAAALQQKDNADERPGLGHLATGLGELGLYRVSAAKARSSLENDLGKLTRQEAEQLSRMMGADGRLRACLETHLSIMKRFSSMLAMAI